MIKVHATDTTVFAVAMGGSRTTRQEDQRWVKKVCSRPVRLYPDGVSVELVYFAVTVAPDDAIVLSKVQHGNVVRHIFHVNQALHLRVEYNHIDK